MSDEPAENRLERALPIAVVSVVAVAYVATAARSILGPDNPEFATLFAVGGVAHPSGYPLYVLWLRAFRWLPAASPAHGAALATVIAAVLSLIMLYRACRVFGASRAASSLVLAAYAFSTRAWILSTHAEVFAPNALVALAIVWGVRAPSLRGFWRVAFLGLFAGLGLSNHHSIIALAPIGLYGAIVGVREDSHRRVRAVAAGVVALMVGLLPYGYLLVCARNPGDRAVWGDPSTFAGLLFHFRRGEYGTTTFAVKSERSDRIGQVLILALDLLRSLVALPLIALAAPLVRRREGTRSPVPSIETWLLIASFLLAGPIFVLLFNLTTVGLDRIVVERFHLLPLALLGVLSAPHLDPPLKRLFSRPALTAAVVAAVVVLGALFSIVDVREHQRPSVELYVKNTLKLAPARAIILGTGDHRFGGFSYARRALMLRTDVDYVDPIMLHHPWYHRQISARLGLTLIAPERDPLTGRDSISTPALAAQLLDTGRPLFLANAFTQAIEARFPTYPIGTLVRVLPPGQALPDPLTLLKMNEDAVAQFELETEPTEIGTWGGDLQPAYATPWLTLSRVFSSTGDLARAEACKKRGDSLMPIQP